jgi:hypothetical protein
MMHQSKPGVRRRRLSVHPLAAIGVFAFDKDGHAGLQEVLFGREEVVTGDEHRATQPLRSKIDQFSEVHF